MHFHQKIHEYLIEYRNTIDPSFNFIVRQRASTKDKNYVGGKFAHGLVFQGNNKYCFVGLVDRSGGANATRSVGLIFKPKDNGYAVNFDIVFPGEKDQELINFYKNLASKFEDVKWDPKGTRSYKTIGEFKEGQPEFIYNWLKTNYPIIKQTVIESGIEDLIPSNEKFKELQENLNNKLKEAKVKPQEKKVKDLFELYDDYLNNIRKGEIMDSTRETYVRSASETIPERWKKWYHEKFEGFEITINNLKKIVPLFDPGFTGSYSFIPFINKLIEDYRIVVPPTNKILYGPPGTGKTYATKEMAVSIIDKGFIDGMDKALSIKEKRKLITDKYDTLCKTEQIVFTTFHQSMSYEDFVEGIKPIPPISEASSINYKIEDGVFKNLCKKASEVKSSSNFDDAYSKFVNDVAEAGTIELKSLAQKKPFNVRINSNETAVAIPKTEIATEMGITKEMMREYIVNNVIKDWKTYTTAIGEYIKENYNVSVENTNSETKNYVLIIDEINRGNVSAIFGELITLIESDKRIGQTEQLFVKLPYSKKDFGVPANLHIIGTMNTADRSVEALDTALRRRFQFKEMMPDYEIIENAEVAGVLLSEVLKTINKRIEMLVDRDHTIGHSYFIGIDNEKDLALAFNDKILPLLQEYFYGDYGKIGLVIGKGFVEEENANDIEFSDFPYEGKEDFKTPRFKLNKLVESNIMNAIHQLLGKTENNTHI